jgi:hypothetical protein
MPQQYIIICTRQNADYIEKNITVFEVRSSQNPKQRNGVLTACKNSRKGYVAIPIGHMTKDQAMKVAEDVRVHIVGHSYKVVDGYIDLCKPAAHSDNEFSTQHIDIVINYITRVFGNNL